MSLAILCRLIADGAQAAAGLQHAVERVLRLEVVVGLADVDAQLLREHGADARRRTPGACSRRCRRRCRRAPLRKAPPARAAGAPIAAFDLAGVAEELLAEADGRRVLEVRAAGLDDAPELAATSPRSAGLQARRARERACRRSRRAPATWMAVGITSFEDWPLLTWSFGWTSFEPRSPPRISRGAVGDDLVRVHVRGGAGAGLEDVDHEVVVELAVDDLARGLLDARPIGRARGGRGPR